MSFKLFKFSCKIRVIIMVCSITIPSLSAHYIVAVNANNANRETPALLTFHLIWWFVKRGSHVNLSAEALLCL